MAYYEFYSDFDNEIAVSVFYKDEMEIFNIAAKLVKEFKQAVGDDLTMYHKKLVTLSDITTDDDEVKMSICKFAKIYGSFDFLISVEVFVSFKVKPLADFKKLIIIYCFIISTLNAVIDTLGNTLFYKGIVVIRNTSTN